MPREMMDTSTQTDGSSDSSAEILNQNISVNNITQETGKLGRTM